MEFHELPGKRANRLINHGPTILVSSRHGEKSNIMTAAWAMPVSHKPPMVAVAIGPSRCSHDLIIAGGEFVVNVPGADLLDAVWCCGTIHGHKVDKFNHCNLHQVQGKHVQAPLIAECIGAIECKLREHPTVGDHTIMIGEVLAAWAKPDLFDERLQVEKPGARTLHHLGGREFCLPGEICSKEGTRIKS